MLKFLLDTNICIFAMKNKPEHIRRQFQLHYGQLCISSVVYMELVYGAEKSSRVTENLENLEGFSARLDVIEYDANAAAHTGQIRANLEKSGKTIGAYDLMIAGHARSQGLILVSNNVREFERVSGLRLEDWTRQTTD
ncbi:hypothetical protein ALP90_200210 [Pseudomonas amygdali pv. ulmi]|uniref:Ribonuclease VapC n=1 Tax=Pseudomonas amygdali pv. ulmi TaxID=251720 RepID=A0A3M4S8G0_PSEA0|nr:tRNA(fMet)-specific endonuclease VapC [Pseudomonas amygdali]RMR11243.1 hypothetical protein ALP90_200210 [Pseudomonas amygdali pv. ulmi]